MGKKLQRYEVLYLPTGHRLENNITENEFYKKLLRVLLSSSQLEYLQYVGLVAARLVKKLPEYHNPDTMESWDSNCLRNKSKAKKFLRLTGLSPKELLSTLDETHQLYIHYRYIYRDFDSVPDLLTREYVHGLKISLSTLALVPVQN